jgi:hypothetical protein
MRTRIALAALTAVAGLGALAGFAGQASAANVSAETSATGYIKQPTTSFSSPSANSAPVHLGLTDGTPVEVHCFREGDKVGGNARWFIIEKDGDAGYVHQSAIWAPIETPHCGMG